MSSKLYKSCAVPQCPNTLKTTPEKLFVYVPHEKAMRKKWFNLARRDSTSVSSNSSVYFCEDHFDLPNDMVNYMEYHVMGSVLQVRMKPGCIPTKFECQPDRRKLTSNTTERQYILKKRRKVLNEECEKDVEERGTISNHLVQIQWVQKKEARKTADKSIQVHRTHKFRSKAIQTGSESVNRTTSSRPNHQSVSTSPFKFDRHFRRTPIVNQMTSPLRFNRQSVSTSTFEVDRHVRRIPIILRRKSKLANRILSNQ